MTTRQGGNFPTGPTRSPASDTNEIRFSPESPVTSRRSAASPLRHQRLSSPGVQRPPTVTCVRATSCPRTAMVQNDSFPVEQSATSAPQQNARTGSLEFVCLRLTLADDPDGCVAADREHLAARAGGQVFRRMCSTRRAPAHCGPEPTRWLWPSEGVNATGTQVRARKRVEVAERHPAHERPGATHRAGRVTRQLVPPLSGGRVVQGEERILVKLGEVGRRHRARDGWAPWRRSRNGVAALSSPRGGRDVHAVDS